MNSCAKNLEGDKAEVRKVINWYSEVRRVIHEAAQMFMT